MNVIAPDDLERVFCVLPKLNNPRILRQSGAFFIFGDRREQNAHGEVHSPVPALYDQRERQEAHFRGSGEARHRRIDPVPGVRNRRRSSQACKNVTPALTFGTPAACRKRPDFFLSRIRSRRAAGNGPRDDSSRPSRTASRRVSTRTRPFTNK